NRGDETAPAFEIDFVLARDAAGNEPVSIVPLRCQVAGGLAAGQSTTCTAANPFALPLVGAGDYHLVATVDRLGQVSESDDENNRNAAPLALTTAAGVALEQRLFRALDGTVYQLVQAVPQRAATAADAFRITTLAGAVGEVADCTVA